MPPIVFPTGSHVLAFLRNMCFPLLGVAIGIFFIMVRHDFLRWLGLGVIAIALISGIIVAICTLPEAYVVNADSLIIRRGIRSQRVALARIRYAVLTGSSSTADAARKVRLTLDTGRRVISPKRRNEFIRVLKERAYL